MDEPLIRYKNVNINQQELGVLEDVNLELNKGEFVYLIGKVGSGKTSLLKTHLRRVGHSIGRRRSIRLQYEQYQAQAYPPNYAADWESFSQDFQLLTDRNVHSNLSFVLRATGWSNKIAIK